MDKNIEAKNQYTMLIGSQVIVVTDHYDSDRDVTVYYAETYSRSQYYAGNGANSIEVIGILPGSPKPITKRLINSLKTFCPCSN